MLKSRLCIAFFAFAVGCAPAQKPLTDYVNPMLGTATLWDLSLIHISEPTRH